MSSFEHLTVKQRWSLAFEVGRLGFTFRSNLLSEDLDKNAQRSGGRLSVQEWVQFSPKEIVANRSEISISKVKQLRANPELMFSRTQTPLSVSREQLSATLDAFKKGQFREANTFAVSAYLDGFELIETSLDAHDKPLRKKIETALLGLRQILNASTPLKNVEEAVLNILTLLENADDLLSKSSMSDATLFSASFIILLREGIEALLVVLALFTILMRSDQKEAVKYLHFGWIVALFAGAITWWVAQHLITISGASREIMEGVAAMLAALVIFYVSFWMHNKSKAGQWQKYIKENIDRSLNSGTLWGISGLAFIAVYREIFETVLFYQSLMTQTADSQMSIFALGFGLAVLVLAVFSWLMIKFSVKLPISQFFSITTYMLLVLSFILIGKAISALQEAAVVSISSMPISFQVDWLGINSTWQGLIAQMTILFLSLGLILKSKLGQAKQS